MLVEEICVGLDEALEMLQGVINTCEEIGEDAPPEICDLMASSGYYKIIDDLRLRHVKVSDLLVRVANY